MNLTSVTAIITTPETAEHRRRMVVQGKTHLTQIAISAAGAPYEPLPRERRAAKRTSR